MVNVTTSMVTFRMLSSEICQLSFMHIKLKIPIQNIGRTYRFTQNWSFGVILCKILCFFLGRRERGSCRWNAHGWPWWKQRRTILESGGTLIKTLSGYVIGTWIMAYIWLMSVGRLRSFVLISGEPFNEHLNNIQFTTETSVKLNIFTKAVWTFLLI